MRIWSGHRGFTAGGPRALGDREGRDTEAVLKHKPAAALEDAVAVTDSGCINLVSYPKVLEL